MNDGRRYGIVSRQCAGRRILLSENEMMDRNAYNFNETFSLTADKYERIPGSGFYQKMKAFKMRYQNWLVLKLANDKKIAHS